MDTLSLLALLQSLPKEPPQQHPSSQLQNLANILNQNMRQQQRPEEMMHGPVSIEGGGAMEGGILSGGGRATVSMPNTLGGILQLYLGGGGAIGSVNTPYGQQRIREFQPEFGAQFRRQF